MSVSAKEPNFNEAYERTRKSLIERLNDWEDQKSWDDFYKTYWRLIYSVAVKSGLKNEEAFDAVQETIICIAKQQKEGKYDPTGLQETIQKTSKDFNTLLEKRLSQ